MMMEVKYIDHMGDDRLVANAARVSFKKFKTEFDNKDINLLDYLERHDHWSPFSHPQVCMHFKAPIFVARQLAKHQIGFAWNEVSRRYVDEKPEFFVPHQWRKRAENKKQGSLEESVEEPFYNRLHTHDCRTTTQAYTNLLEHVLDLYHDMIEHGVAPEQARMLLPQSLYTEWYWTGSLAAWGRMACLRLKPDAQVETKEIARMCSTIVNQYFPVSWPLLLRAVDINRG